MSILFALVFTLVDSALFFCTGSTVFLASFLLWTVLMFGMEWFLKAHSRWGNLGGITVIIGCFYGLYYYGSHVEGTDWEILFVQCLLFMTACLIDYRAELKKAAPAEQTMDRQEKETP